MDDTYERVKRVYDNDLQERSRWEPLWKECSEFTQPEYMDFDSRNGKSWDPSQLIGDTVYDGSARVAAQIASAGMFGYSCNPADEWVSVGVHAKGKLSPAARDWVHDVNWAVMDAFERYDLYEHLVPAFNSIIPIGTATITTEEDVTNDGIRYRFWHPGDYVIGTDGYNRVNRFGTEWEYEGHEILNHYTPDELGPEIMERIASNVFDTFTVKYVVMENSLYEPGNPFATHFRWAGYHLHPLESGENRIMKVDGFHKFPAAVWRWTVQGRLTYGLSAAAKALPDIYILNQSAKTRLEAEQKMADPPMQIPKEMMDDYHLGPGGRNFYRSADRQINPINARWDYPAAIDAVNRYTDIVNKHFFTDFFVLLAQSSTRRTQAEVAELMQEKAAMLGTVVSFMNKSFLDPIVEQTLSILGKQNKLPEPPRDLLDADLKMSFLGPLSVAQKHAQLNKRIISPLQTSLQFAQYDQSVLDQFNFDKVTRKIGEAYSIPFGILREEQEVEDIRRGRAEMQMQQLESQREQEEQELTLKYGAKAIEPGSLLDEAKNAGQI